MAVEKIDAVELNITSSATTANVDKLIDALGRLGTALDKLKSKSVSVNIKKTGTAASTASKSVDKLSNSFLNQAVKITALVAVFRRLTKVIGSSIAESANYIKSLNMFTVSLGDYAENATKFGETVSEALGIDISGWQKAQGIFQTLITGFGVTGDKAAYMSQNLTQLSYDIASFYGLTNEEAANKLKSALSGRLEPIRKLGYDLSQSKLVNIGQNPKNYGKQTFAINKETGAIEANTVATDNNTKHKIVNFNQLTQAEKVQLRYIALMTQVTQVQGSYAAALNDPANQMKVFKEQVNQVSRAFGNVFIPVMNKVLPYLSALAQLAKEALQSLAELFGFELPDMKDRTDISKNQKPYDNVVKATGKAAKNAKKMKDYMLGIDELNVINPKTGDTGAGGAGGKGANSNLKNLKLPGYDFLSKAVNNAVKDAKEKIQKLFQDLKDNPLLLKDILIWGGSELFSNFWELVLGKSPDQLKADAEKYGRTLGEQFRNDFCDAVGITDFWVNLLGMTPDELRREAEKRGATEGEMFCIAFANRVDEKRTDFWTMMLGKSPEELGQEAQEQGNTLKEQFMMAFADKVWNDTATFWSRITGDPKELAERAAQTGRDVGDQFNKEMALKIVKFYDNPIGRWIYERSTGRKLDDDLAKLNKALQPKKASAYTALDPKAEKKLAEDKQKANAQALINQSASAKAAQEQGKRYTDALAQSIEDNKNKVQAATKNMVEGAFDQRDEVESITKGLADTCINVYTSEEKTKKAAKAGKSFSKATTNAYIKGYKEVEAKAKQAGALLEAAALRGLTDDGKSKSKFSYVSYQDAKAFYDEISAPNNKSKAYNSGKALASSGNSGAKATVKDFKKTGENASKGFIDGMLILLNASGKAGGAVGAAALEGVKKETKVASPSKEFAKIGKFSVMGYANAMKSNTKLATDAAKNLGRSVLNAFGEASDLSNSVIMNGTIANPMGRRASIPINSNSRYAVSASNESAMANLASSIYQAVVNGMINANAGEGKGGDIKVIIDGKEVFKTVQAESRKRGYAIGNGTFSR